MATVDYNAVQCDSTSSRLIQVIIQWWQEGIRSRENMTRELVGIRAHPMRCTHAVIVVGAARSRWSMVAIVNSNVCGFGNGGHAEDLLIA